MKKIVRAALAVIAIVVAALMFFAVACGEANDPPEKDPGIVTDKPGENEPPEEEDPPEGEDPPEEEDPPEDTVMQKAQYETMKLMSFNIRTQTAADTGDRAWDARKEDVVAFIEGKEADVISLQELKVAQYEYFASSPLAEDYGIVFHDRGDGEGLAVLYDKSDIELVSENVFWLSETPEQESTGWGATYLRICVNTLLKTKNGAYLNVFDVHLDHQSELARENGVQLILDRAEAAGYPAVLMGDFNAEESSGCYKVAASGLNDSRVKAKVFSDSGMTYNNYGSGGSLIDYCFVSDDIISYTFEICDEKTADGRYYSDHYAVVSWADVPIAPAEDGTFTTEPDPAAELIELRVLDAGVSGKTLLPGDGIDESRVAVMALYDDGGREVFAAGRKADCTVSPEAFEAGDTEITVTYGGKSATFPVNVVGSDLTKVTFELNEESRVFAAGAETDLGGLAVMAHYGDEYSVAVTDYSIVVADEGGEETVFDDPTAVVLDAGEYQLGVRYKGVDSERVAVSAFSGYIVSAAHFRDKWKAEGGKIVESDENLPEPGESYVERLSTPVANGSRDDGMNPGIAGTDPKYMGGVSNGAKFAFHIWSDVETDADVILRAASGYATVDPERDWDPETMGDMQFNRVFDVQFGQSVDGPLTEIEVDDDVVLPGSEKENASDSLWTKWADVSFGRVHLSKGDNVFVFTVISDYKDVYGYLCAANVGRLEVRFVDPSAA